MNRVSLLCGCALATAAFAAGPAGAEAARTYAIPAGSLADALNLYASQSDRQIFFSTALVEGLSSDGLTGRYGPDAALDRLLAGTGLTWSTTRPGLIYLRRIETDVRPPAAAQLSEIVVTGTLLRSSGPPSSPVTTLDRDALDRRGLGTVAEVLAELPQNYAGAGTPIATTTGADRGGSNGAYASSVNLRGLGPQSTLLLIDGRRLAGSGFRGELNDLSAVPSGAVERVDVLLDGASAIYGSDAVAGVVNVIMRRAFDGQESRLRLGAVEGGGEDLIVSHAAGRTWDGGSALLAYEYQNAQGLSSLDRPYTRDGDLRPFGGSDRRNLFSSPGNIVVYDPVARAYRSQWAIRPPAGGAATSPADFAAGETNLQAVSLGADLTPDVERHSLYGRVHQSIGRLDLTGDLRFSRRDYELAGAASLGVFTVTAANPYFVSPSGAAAHTIAYSFEGDLGPTRQFGESRSLGASLGGAYDLGGGWSLDGYLAYAEERGESGVTNRLNTAFLNEALGVTADNPATPFRAAVDGYFNPFGDGAANTDAVLAFIGSGYVAGLDRSRHHTLNLMIDGPIARLPGGEVQIAVGGQLRRETFASRTESLTGAQPVLSVSPDAERAIAALFGEVRIPLIGEANRRPGVERLSAAPDGQVLLVGDGSVWRVRDGGVAEPVGEGGGYVDAGFNDLQKPIRLRSNEAPRGAAAWVEAGGVLTSVEPDGPHAIGPISEGGRVAAVGDRSALVLTARQGVAVLDLLWDGRSRRLAALNTEFASRSLSQPVAVDHRDRVDRPARSWLFPPADRPLDRARGVIVMPYPGALDSGRIQDPFSLAYGARAALLAAQGFAVLSPFLPIDAPEGLSIDEIGRGVGLALDAALADYPALPADRVGLLGHSHGGYLVLGMGARASRYRAIVSWAGMSDLAGEWGEFTPVSRTAPVEFATLRQQSGWVETGQGEIDGPPYRNPDAYVAASPYYEADRIQAPVLLITADRDFVPLSQSERIFSAINREGGRARLVTYWGEGHFNWSPANIRDVYREIVSWFDEAFTAPSVATDRAGSRLSEPLP